MFFRYKDVCRGVAEYGAQNRTISKFEIQYQNIAIHYNWLNLENPVIRALHRLPRF